MQDEIALNDDSLPKNTGVRYDKKTGNYGLLSQDVYSVKDLSEAIGVHHTTILEHIASGKLRALRLGGPAGYRISKNNVINWLENIHSS